MDVVLNHLIDRSGCQVCVQAPLVGSPAAIGLGVRRGKTLEIEAARNCSSGDSQPGRALAYAALAFTLGLPFRLRTIRAISPQARGPVAAR